MPSPATVPPPGNNASTKTLMGIPVAVRMEAIVMPCTQNSIHIFSANEVSLSKTLKLVIWLVSLSFRRSMLSCLVFRSLLSLLIHFLMASSIPLSYSGLSRIFSSLHYSHLTCCCNSTFFDTSTFHEPLILLNCLSSPRSLCMGKSSEDSSSSCSMRLSMILTALFVISWSHKSFALAVSDVEGSSSSTLSSMMVC